MSNFVLKVGVTLSADVKTKIGIIADSYHKKSGKIITITSGTRTAKSQASSMYGKLAAGSDMKVYRDQASAQAIKKIYDEAVKANKTKIEIISELTQTIEKQIKEGKYISKHLKKGAVDVRSRDMTIAQKKQFRESAEATATKVILETRPPHWHIQF